MDTDSSESEPVSSLKSLLGSVRVLINNVNASTGTTQRASFSRKRPHDLLQEPAEEQTEDEISEDQSPETKRRKISHITPLTRTKKNSAKSKCFSCDQCDKSYCRKGDLTRHKKVSHSEGAVHSCDKCSQTFSLRGNLMRHHRTVHGPRCFKCKVCDKSFTQQSDVDRHMVVHTGERNFECHLCNRRFTQSVHLKYHLSSIHSLTIS